MAAPTAGQVGTRNHHRKRLRLWNEPHLYPPNQQILGGTMTRHTQLAALVIGLAVPLTIPNTPAAAAESPLVPYAVTIVINNDDSTRAFRIHQGASCTGTYRVLYPGTTSEAWVSDVNSMRFYEDARVAVKYKDGRLITVKNVNVAETASASTCYPTMTNERRYEVYSHPLAFAGAGNQ